MNPWIKKLLTLVGLTLALLLPQVWIQDLVEEREQRGSEAAAGLLQEWGTRLEIRGPLLEIPTLPSEINPLSSSVRLRLIATSLKIDGQVDVETRSRGIYGAQVYQGVMTLSGTFVPLVLPPPGSLDWSGARVKIFLSSRTGLAGTGLLTSGGADIPMSLASVEDDEDGVTLEGPLASEGVPVAATEIPFSVKILFKGVERLTVSPLSLSTTAKISSNWDWPSFLGNWLPTRRQVGDGQGFIAEYAGGASMQDFGRLSLQSGGFSPMGPAIAGFSVDLLGEVSHYLKVMRSVKYAALFVVMTFIAFFLFETFSGLRLHPIQYFSVGAALTIFYLLLLSLSERINFSYAYLIAATAVIALISGYARSILQRKGRSAIMALSLIGLYGFNFTLLQLEQESLIAGSIGVFLALTAFMYLTRNVDWYKAIANPSVDVS